MLLLLFISLLLDLCYWHGLTIAAASFVVERKLEGAWAAVVAAHGLGSCGTGLVAAQHVESFQTRDRPVSLH